MTLRASWRERLNGKAEVYKHLETPHFNLPANEYQLGWNEAMLFIHERYGARPELTKTATEERDGLH